MLNEVAQGCSASAILFHKHPLEEVKKARLGTKASNKQSRRAVLR